MTATLSAVGSVSASRSVRSGRFYCRYLLITFTATYDVQSVTAEISGENSMDFTVEFIENTTATGYFLVLLNESGPPDMFRAIILRPGNNMTSTEKVPASTYSTFVYDLEENGLPNTNPAYEQNNTFTVYGVDESGMCTTT